MKRRRRTPRPSPLIVELEMTERNCIALALAATSTWNVAQAARKLGIPLSTLKYKMHRLGMKRR